MVNAKLGEELGKLRFLVSNTMGDGKGGGDADTGEENPARKEFMSMYVYWLFNQFY